MTTNQHATDDQTIGYLYRTLSDAEREVIDDHLFNCPECRARLTFHEVQQRQIDHDLKAAIRQVSPSDQMIFATIAPHLPNRRPINIPLLKLDTATPILITAAGVLFALIGLVQRLSAFLSTADPQPPGALPTLAGLFFVFVSVGQLERALTIRPRFAIMALLTGLLWVGTAILGLLDLLVLLDLSLWFFISLGSTNMQAASATILVMIVGAIFYIAGVIGGADYHIKRVGQPSSWKLFAWILAIELLILVVPHFVF